MPQTEIAPVDCLSALFADEPTTDNANTLSKVRRMGVALLPRSLGEENAAVRTEFAVRCNFLAAAAAIDIFRRVHCPLSSDRDAHFTFSEIDFACIIRSR
jgi:hypothetical protein